MEGAGGSGSRHIGGLNDVFSRGDDGRSLETEMPSRRKKPQPKASMCKNRSLGGKVEFTTIHGLYAPRSLNTSEIEAGRYALHWPRRWPGPGIDSNTLEVAVLAVSPSQGCLVFLFSDLGYYETRLPSIHGISE